MIDHVGIYVTNYTESKRFYEKALSALGHRIIAEEKELYRSGFGAEGAQHATFWLTSAGLPIMQPGADMSSSLRTAFPMLRLHIAFKANSKQAVNHFYEQALDAGARSNGIPEMHEDKGEKSYAAYVNDPDGHNIGAVYSEKKLEEIDNQGAEEDLIDHVGIYVIDYKRSKYFYEKALAALGYKTLSELREMYRIGFGKAEDKTARFWVTGLGTAIAQPFYASIASSPAFPMIRLHLAFKAEQPNQVDRFYEQALDADGKSNGIPGPRAEYHHAYYAGYVNDPDGHNIEAVCHNFPDSDTKNNPSKPNRKISFLF